MKVSFGSKLELRQWDKDKMVPFRVDYDSAKLRETFGEMLDGEIMDEFVSCVDDLNTKLQNNGRDDTFTIGKKTNAIHFETPHYRGYDLRVKELVGLIKKGELVDKFMKYVDGCYN